ncbi:MAG: hypothetical protein QM831_19380 [Kofleriaceae bacterium]
MSRWALIAAIIIAEGAGAGRAVASPKVTTTDVNSARELRAGSTDVIAHDLAKKLATAACSDCRVDASVTKLVVEQTTEGTSVMADIHLTVTDEHGVIISMVSGQSRAVARREKVATLRDEALHGAISSASPKITRVLATHKPAPKLDVTRFAIK